MVRIVFFTCCLFISLQAYTQDNKQFVHQGLIRFMGTLSYGKLFSHNTNNIFLHGDIEYYSSDNFSFRSDGYIFLNSFNGLKPMVVHHSIFSGINYHFKTNSHIDPYVGLI
jgi:hypothetical protein